MSVPLVAGPVFVGPQAAAEGRGIVGGASLVREAARETHDLVRRSRYLLRELQVPQSMAEVFLPEYGSRPS
jgi:hypothetical protein